MNKYVKKYRVLIERDEQQNPLEFTYLIGTGSFKNSKIYRYSDNELALTVCGGSSLLYKNTIKKFAEHGVEIINLMTCENEAVIRFNEKDIETVVRIIKIKTDGAKIAPESIKNRTDYKEIKKLKYDNLTEEQKESRRIRGVALKERLEANRRG